MPLEHDIESDDQQDPPATKSGMPKIVLGLFALLLLADITQNSHHDPSIQEQSSGLRTGGEAILKKGYACRSQEGFDELAEAIVGNDNERLNNLTDMFHGVCLYYGRDDLKLRVHIVEINKMHNSVHIRFYPGQGAQTDWWVLPLQLEAVP